MEYVIQPLLEIHYPEVAEIFTQGIEGGNATYELASPTWNDWHSGHLDHSRWVAVQSNQVLGWVALSPVSSRTVFRGVAELSIYIHSEYRHLGIGSTLMEKVIESSETHGIWTIQSGIFPENEASIALHERFGFSVVGIREKIGQMPKSGEWRDIVLMERRSKAY